MENPVSEYESERELLYIYNEFYPQFTRGLGGQWKRLKRRNEQCTILCRVR